MERRLTLGFASGYLFPTETCPSRTMTPIELYMTLLLIATVCISIAVLVYRYRGYRNVAPYLVCLFVKSRCSGEALINRLRRWIAKLLQLGHLERTGATYTLVYHHGSTRHRVVFPIRRGPTRIHSIVTERDGIEEDVTSSIREVMGPGHNFHGIPTTPKMLGYDTLTVHRYGGASDRFEADDVIAL